MLPPCLGDIMDVARPARTQIPFVMTQSFTPNEQDGWSQALGAVSRYFDRVLEDPQLPPSPVRLVYGRKFRSRFSVIIEGVHVQTVRLLGERTAEMHLALAHDTESPNFAPEPFSLQHQRSVFQSIRGETKQTFALLARTLSDLEEHSRNLAENVLRHMTINIISRLPASRSDRYRQNPDSRGLSSGSAFVHREGFHYPRF